VRASIAVSWLWVAACGATAAPVQTSERAEPRREREEPPRLLTDEEVGQTHAQAMTVHVQAQGLLTECSDGDEGACRRALQFFELAADTWRALVEGRPNDASPEWSFMLAQALMALDRFEPAAEAAESYVAANAPEWRVQAARLSLSARERAAAATTLREDPPSPEGDPPEVRAIDMPAPVASLVEARLRFAEVVSDLPDEQQAARTARLEAALVLHRYGHWERASAVLRALFESGCAGEGAWDGSATAWRTLRDMSEALGHHDAVRALGEEVTARSCDFGAGAVSCAQASDDPRCMARTDRVMSLLRGGTQWLGRARAARPSERAPFFVRAGDAFLGALEMEGELDARGRVTALEQAVSAFREAGAMDRAAEVDERIVRELDPRRFDAADRAYVNAAVASALARMLETAIAAQQNEVIVTIARRILGPQFDLPDLAAERERARAALPDALLATNRQTEAARAFADLAAASEDPNVRRQALLRSAIVLGCAQRGRSLRAFVVEHRGEDHATDDVIQALWRLAECQRRSVASLEELAAAGEGVRGLSTDSRAYVAEARFALVDRDHARLTTFRIRVPVGGDVEAMVADLEAQLAEPTEQLRELAQRYAHVEELNSPRWSAAARQRSGAAFEALERAILEASYELPRDIADQRRILSPAAFEMVRRNADLRQQEILRTRTAPFRCQAVAHYQRALAIAAAANVESAEVTTARERAGAIQVPDRCPR
jgi:hypothetical protein